MTAIPSSQFVDAHHSWAAPRDPGPYARESAMARDAGTNVRAFAMASFPLVVFLLWHGVAARFHPVIVVGAVLIVLLNAASYFVPWERVPRWTETVLCDLSIVVLVGMAACAGGSDSIFGFILVVPLLWLALFADTVEILVGFALVAIGLFLPLETMFEQLPHQGSTIDDVALLLLAATLMMGVRPVVVQLREQIAETRLAVHALRAAQTALAHDLRNPLAATYAVATLAAQRVQPDGPTPDAKLSDHLDLLLQSTRRMEATIAGVMELSRAGERLEVVERVELPAMVDQVAAAIPSLELERGALPDHVVGDPASLRRLLRSLFELAIQRAPDETGSAPSSRVLIEGEERADGWRLTVRHRGTPMDVEALAARLEPRRRSDDPPRDEDTLDLSIVAAIVEQHGGLISVERHDGAPAITFTLARNPRHAAAHANA